MSQHAPASLENLAPMLALMVSRGEAWKAKRVLDHILRDADANELRAWAWQMRRLVDAAAERQREGTLQTNVP